MVQPSPHVGEQRSLIIEPGWSDQKLAGVALGYQRLNAVQS